MSRFKLRALLGASALFAASAASVGAANATASVNGGGSSLLAPYWTQVKYCFDNDPQNAFFYVKGLPATTVTPPAASGVTCAPVKGYLVNYESTGSGAGQAGVMAHTGVIKDSNGVTLFGSKDAAGTQKVFTSIQYGLSDNSLTNTDLAVYNVGTSDSVVTRTYTTTFNGNSTTTTSPMIYQGIFIDPTPNNLPAASRAFNFNIVPAAAFGPLIQFPVAIDPVALAYNPTYTAGDGTTASFTINTSDSKLHLDQAAYCQIFNGDINDWNDPALTALNGGTSLTGGASVPITRVGRSDSSGTTSIFTRHLASAACTTAGRLVTADKYAAGTTTIPAGAQSLYTLVSGSGGVATTINSSNASIGYIGADYVLPAVNNTGATTAQLNAASLAQGSGFVQPTADAALIAFGTLKPPQSNSNGTYNAADTTTDRRDPTQWVQSTAATAPLANPTAAGAYPITGTTNYIGYTCYFSASSAADLNRLLKFVDSTQVTAILNNAALARLPNAWSKAITETFLTLNPNTQPLNLGIDYKGDTGTSANPVCQGSAIKGA